MTYPGLVFIYRAPSYLLASR